MKLRKLVRNAVLGTVAWNFLQKRYQHRVHARRRTRAGWAGSVLFAAGAGVAWMFREELAGLLRSFRAEPYVPLAETYAPPPPSRKKQQQQARREAAEKRAHQQAAHQPPLVRVEKNAAPDLAVPLKDIVLKH